MVCNVMFIIFTIACAVANSIEQLIVFRFFAGTFRSLPMHDAGTDDIL